MDAYNESLAVTSEFDGMRNPLLTNLIMHENVPLGQEV
jgi:hypothetical protein